MDRDLTGYVEHDFILGLCPEVFCQTSPSCCGNRTRNINCTAASGLTPPSSCVSSPDAFQKHFHHFLGVGTPLFQRFFWTRLAGAMPVPLVVARDWMELLEKNMVCVSYHWGIGLTGCTLQLS